MKISREIKTGIIVLGGILLFILGFSYLKSTPLFDNSKTFYAVYQHVGGLQSGTQVTINGFSVGKVNDIKFNDTSGNLLVTFTVDNGFTFSKNSSAELYDTGIIGGKGIQIKPVFDDAEMAKSGDTLPSSTRPGLTELVQQRLTPLQMKVEGAVTNADSLLMNVNDILDLKTRKDLRESIAGLNELVRSFQGSANSLNQILTDNKDDLDKSITNLGVITDNFSKLSDTLANAGLGETIKGLQSTMGKINDMMGKIEGGEGSLGKLVNDKELYNNLADASRELDLLLQDFRLNPKRYVNVSVFGKKQIDYTIPEEDPADK
ncbi:phospholipid/cholesterol/gamma-HCH transport system substrate-binding protein [Arenibacter palladensis]|uniref:Phospholipid/cholesterol/gamma-HCH transport system substrate-binding protein n=1 Tax=Arenibacter palladensis TaxID=237373 RepID=A0A1M5EIG5_9FLAO|nr:MlaD family protein [Arenibacter palladensis]MDO6605721.1 MlaD family protein [Arenibacter palladensis]SHF79029.1 phospholipid/cholesterol/gamma-HCH transport system substrate-binding protein [Arenibacter palladensis]